MRGQISPKFHVKNGVRTENFTQISLCWGAALTNLESTELMILKSPRQQPNTAEQGLAHGNFHSSGVDVDGYGW